MYGLSSAYEHRTVAVIGAGGYLGAALTAALSRTPANLLLVSRGPLPSNQRAQVLTVDVEMRPCWDVIAACADIVLFVAGNSSVQAAAADPIRSRAANVRPLEHLLEAARRSRRPLRIVHASSARVYGDTAGKRAIEQDASPITPFGAHIFEAEQLLATAGVPHVQAVSLRLGNVYGPSPGDSITGKVVMNKIARLAARGEDLPVYGGGGYLRDYIYIDDVINAFLRAAILPDLSGPFNVASGVGVSVREAFELAADRAAARTGVRSRVVDAPWPSGETPVEARNFTAEISRFSTAARWKPQTTLGQGLDNLVIDALRQGEHQA